LFYWHVISHCSSFPFILFFCIAWARKEGKGGSQEGCP
jgi:hypothetical protein